MGTAIWASVRRPISERSGTSIRQRSPSLGGDLDKFIGFQMCLSPPPTAHYKDTRSWSISCPRRCSTAFWGTSLVRIVQTRSKSSGRIRARCRANGGRNWSTHSADSKPAFVARRLCARCRATFAQHRSTFGPKLADTGPMWVELSRSKVGRWRAKFGRLWAMHWADFKPKSAGSGPKLAE